MPRIIPIIARQVPVSTYKEVILFYRSFLERHLSESNIILEGAFEVEPGLQRYCCKKEGNGQIKIHFPLKSLIFIY